MAIPVNLGLAAFAIVVLVLIVLSYLVVRYYTDRHEHERLPTVVTTIALTLSLLALFLIPVDILNASEGGGKDQDIKILYYILYASILAFAFVIIPFSYFFYEEFDEDTTTKDRIIGGLKYTVILLVIVIILLIVGIFVRSNSDQKDDNVKEWAQYLSDANNGGQRSIAFAVACLAMIGFLVWITYTAYGLSAFPIGLLKGKRHLAEEASDIQADLEETRRNSRAITSKYMTGKKKSAGDEKKLDLLKRQERILARRATQIDQSNSGIQKVLVVCKPFVFIFGIILCLVTLLLVVSIVLSLVNQITNSCGVSCGFFAKYPQIKNPIDLLLANLAPFFPLDYIAFGSLIFYVFFCTISGIVKIGVRFLWVHLFSIKAHQTQPQGLLLTSVFVMLALLVLNVQILTLAPRYATFGTQTWVDYGNETVNGTAPTPVTRDCSLDAPLGANCTMTQIATFVGTIQLGVPFFGNIFYYAMWVFVGTFLIGTIVTIVRRKSSNIDADDDSEDEDDTRA